MTQNKMSVTYPVGSVVVYEGELPCDDAAHTGSVTATVDDASGDQVVTVEFDCGLTQDIPASELQPAG
jgi:hypothetical protein